MNAKGAFRPLDDVRIVEFSSSIAGAVLYFVSPASSYTTGVCLPVDGGYLVN